MTTTVHLAGCCAYCLTVHNEMRQAVAIYRGSSLCDEHLRQTYDEAGLGGSAGGVGRGWEA